MSKYNSTRTKFVYFTFLFQLLLQTEAHPVASSQIASDGEIFMNQLITRYLGFFDGFWSSYWNSVLGTQDSGVWKSCKSLGKNIGTILDITLGENLGEKLGKKFGSWLESLLQALLGRSQKNSITILHFQQSPSLGRDPDNFRTHFQSRLLFSRFFR